MADAAVDRSGDDRDWLTGGGLWLALMLAFDAGFGRAVFHFPWERIARDFDPRAGGWLGFGMTRLFLPPPAPAWLRRALA